MGNIDEILQEVVELLNVIHGVNVLEASATEEFAKIELTIETHDAHLLLVHCAEASNVPFDCWAMSRPDSEDGLANPALALRYQYRISNRSNQVVDDLCMLGSFLAWVMCRMGKISSEKEKEAVGMFGTMSKQIKGTDLFF